MASISGSSGITGTGTHIDVNTGHAIYPQLTTIYFGTDHLGSSRLLTGGYGYPIWRATYLPYGQEYNPQTKVDNFKFTGLEHDDETGLDHASFRQFSNIQGRWSTPDPFGGSMNMLNPQSLNRYNYVGNNPLNGVDPSGLVCSGNVGETSDTVCNPTNFGGGGGSGGNGLGGDYFTLMNIRVMAWDSGPMSFYSEIGPGLRMYGGVWMGWFQIGTVMDNIGWFPFNGPSGPPSQKKGLNPAQCKAARTLLQREDQSGTTVAAWQSAIGFGDGTVQAFNSSDPGNAYTNTAAGVVKVDWFTDMRLASLIPGPQVPAYVIGKLVWTGDRLATGAPVTNYLPFQDPVETRTMTLATGGYGFRNLFTPEFMKENCGQ